MRKIKRLCAGAVLLFCFRAADAGLTYSEGLESYVAGDFASARLTFERLARLGHNDARHNLAALYYHGQGVDKDLIKAYGWFYLVSESGDQEARGISDRIYQALVPAQQMEAIEFRDSLIRDYGATALRTALLPEMAKTEPDGVLKILKSDIDDYQISEINKSDLGSFKKTKESSPFREYPRVMREFDMEGWVDVEFTIGKHGNVKDIYVVDSSNQGFEQNAIRMLRHNKYAPPLIDGRSVEVYGYQNRVVFTIGGPVMFERSMHKFLDGMREKAEAGDPVYQYFYGYVMSTHPRVKKITEPEMNEWYLKAAQGGFSRAQYALAYSLLYGRGCSPDHAKSVRWLTLAAENDYAHAQLLLGRILFRGQENPEQVQKGLFWINKAAEEGFSPAVMALAWIKATGADEKLRDADHALKLAEPVYEDYPDQVTALETIAAAYAAKGDFKKAVKFQKKAIAEAEDLEWNLEQPRLRLETYSAGKAWYES